MPTLARHRFAKFTDAIQAGVNRLSVGLLAIVGLLLSATRSFAQSITIDPTPLFDGISTNLPWVFSLLSTPYGIMIAVVIVTMFGTLMVAAFRSVSI